MCNIRQHRILPAIRVTVKVENWRKSGPRAEVGLGKGHQDARKVTTRRQRQEKPLPPQRHAAAVPRPAPDPRCVLPLRRVITQDSRSGSPDDDSHAGPPPPATARGGT
jgi:hypothetical protein